MKFKVQVVTLSEDGEEAVQEIGHVERDDLTTATLGLSIDDSKTILQGLQEVVVEWQMNDDLEAQRHCPQCGKLRHRKGAHHQSPPIDPGSSQLLVMGFCPFEVRSKH